MRFHDLSQPENQVAGGPLLKSASNRARLFPSLRHAEIEAIVINDTWESTPQAFWVTTQVGAQPLNAEAANIALEAERDGESPLFVVRSAFGGIGRSVQKNLYVPPASEQLQQLGALTLAEEFPR